MQQAALDLRTHAPNVPPFSATLFEVGPPIERDLPELSLRTHAAQVRGFEVELYSRQARRSRAGTDGPASLLLVDVGLWRVGGYVRWNLERYFSKFEILDELDEKLRLHFPPGSGTVHRADLPVSIPSVRLSSTR